MKTIKPVQFLPILGAFLATACQDAGPTAPFEDLPETLTVEEQLTLEVLSDPASTEVALAMATTQIAAATGGAGPGVPVRT